MKMRLKKLLESGYLKYYAKKLKEIRENLETNTFPPFYDLYKWKGKKLNCYAYALDINVSDFWKKIWFPGQICNPSYDYALMSDVSGHVKKDLDFLGISYRENSERLNPGEWRIAIYDAPTPHDYPIEFHISRQDNNGIWSEKPSWKSKIENFAIPSNTPPDLSAYNLHLEEVLILSKQH